MKTLFSKLFVVVLVVLAFFFGQMTAQPVRTVEAGGPPPGVKLMSEPGTSSQCVQFCGTQSQIDSIVKAWIVDDGDIPVSGKTPTPTMTVPARTPVVQPDHTPTPAFTPTTEYTSTPAVTETPAPSATVQPGNPGNAKPVGKAGEKCGKGFYCPEEGGPGTKGKSDGTKTPKP